MGAYTRFLFFTRMWTARPEGDRLTPLFYVAVPLYVFFFTGSLLEMWHNWGNIGSMTETSIGLALLVTFHKGLNLMWNERKWKRLVRVVENNFNRPQQRLNAQHRAILDDSFRNGRLLWLLWTAIATAMLISMTLTPLGESLFSRYQAGSADVRPIYTNDTDTITQQPLSIWRIPLRAHIEETKGPDEMQRSLILLPGALSPESEDTEASPALDEEMQRRVRDYVEHHETLLKFVNEIEDIVNMVLLDQFFCSAVVICMSAFQLSMGNVGTVKLIAMGQLFFVGLVQIGIFCYYSDLLIEESTQVGYAVYSCEWYHSSLRFRRSASLIMSRARRPSYITFGRFVALSMETYAEIVRMSYMYFTVLTGMNE